MSIRCPHCDGEIQVEPSRQPEVVCSSCHKPVRIADYTTTNDTSVALESVNDDIPKTIDSKPPTQSAVNPVQAPQSSEPSTAQPPGADEVDRIEKLLVSFEEAWRLGTRPELKEFLIGADSLRPDLLVELIHLDLAYCFKANRDPKIEDYLSAHPELHAQSGAVVELALAEFRLRQQHGQAPPLEDFLSRFPGHVDELRVLLLRAPRARKRRFPIRLNCPFCRNPVAVTDTNEDNGMVCPSCGESFTVDVDRTHTWTGPILPKIGKFQLLRDVGHGAFGTVYCARDEELDRIVAVKIPRSGTFSTPADEERFIREARNAAQLEHPVIVRVVDAGRTKEFPYIVSEFVRGVTLADVLTARRFAIRESVRLVSVIAEALEHAHQKGIVHRDLKPANIMIDHHDRPRLMDFGLAKRELSDVTVSVDGRILGTPAYMPPEQARGDARHADRRSDVYSLGVILFELLTGERPFRGNSVMLLHQAIHNEPPGVRSLNNKLPWDLETIVGKCLEKSPDRRYETAQALADDLQRFLNNEPIVARPIGRAERSWRWCQRNPTLVKSAATIFVILVTALAVVSIFWRGESSARQQVTQIANQNAELAIEKQRLYEQESKARQRAVRYFAETRVPTVPENLLRFYPEVGTYHAQVLEREGEQFERLLQEDNTGDPEFERERAQTYVRLGDIRSQLGQTTAANAAYQRAETILTEQLAKQADTFECRLALGVTRKKRATLLHISGDFGTAAGLYQSAIDDLLAASALRPSHPTCFHELGEARQHRAALAETDDLDSAVQLARQAAQDFEAAQALSPKSSEYLRAWGDARSFLASLLARQGKLEEAITMVHEGLRELDKLKLAPTLQDADLIMAREHARIYLASVLRARGEYQRELAVYEQVIVAYETLERAIPESSLVQENLALTRVDLGQALFELGETRRAESVARMAQEAYAAIFSAKSQPHHLEGLAASSATLAEILIDLAQYEEAETLLLGSVQVLRRLGQQFPHILQYQHRLAVCHSQLGRLYAAQQDWESADKSFEEAVREIDELIQESSPEPEYRRTAALVHCHWGNMKYERDEIRRAKEEFTQALQLWNQIATHSCPAQYTNDFASFLVECLDPEMRDASRAIELAGKAIREAPANTTYLSTLGAVQYRAGDWRNAEKTLRQAITKRGEADGRVLFYLAMALWQAGQREEARKSFEQGVSWLRQHRPGNRNLQRLAAEVARLLEAPEQGLH